MRPCWPGASFDSSKIYRPDSIWSQSPLSIQNYNHSSVNLPFVYKVKCRFLELHSSRSSDPSRNIPLENAQSIHQNGLLCPQPKQSCPGGILSETGGSVHGQASSQASFTGHPMRGASRTTIKRYASHASVNTSCEQGRFLPASVAFPRSLHHLNCQQIFCPSANSDDLPRLSRPPPVSTSSGCKGHAMHCSSNLPRFPNPGSQKPERFESQE